MLYLVGTCFLFKETDLGVDATKMGTIWRKNEYRNNEKRRSIAAR